MLRHNGGKFPFFSFLPFLMPQPQSNGHHGYRGGCNSGCNREPQRLTKLWGTGTFLWDCKTCVVPRTGPFSTAFFYPPVAWSQTWGDSHEVCGQVAFWIQDHKGEIQGTEKYQRDSRGKAAQENGPMKLFMNSGVKPQAVQAWIRRQTAHHKLCELNYKTDHCSSLRLAPGWYIQDTEHCKN